MVVGRGLGSVSGGNLSEGSRSDRGATSLGVHNTRSSWDSSLDLWLDMIRMEKVRPVTPEFWCKCACCGISLCSTRDPIFADLNGVPFRAYYCAGCVEYK